MGDGQNGRNIFDDMAENGGKAPVVPAPSPAVSNDIPKPVADARLDHQAPQQVMQVGNQTFPVHGMTSAQAQQHVSPPAAPVQSTRNVFDDMTEQNHPPVQAPSQQQNADTEEQAREKASSHAIDAAWGVAGKVVSHIPDWMVPAQALDLKHQFQEHPAEVAGYAKTAIESPLVHLKAAGTMPAKLLELMKQNREKNLSALEGLPEGVVPSDEDFEAQAKKDFPNTYGIGKGVATLAEGLTSPENLVILAAMPEAKAAPYLSKLASVYFAGTMGKGAWDTAIDTAKNWDSLSQADRAERLTEIFGSTAMTAAAALHLKNQFKGREGKAGSTTKRTLLRPTNKNIANVDVPITAGMQDNPNIVTRTAAALATPGEDSRFQATETKPAARKAAVSAMSLAAEKKLAAHDALVDGTVPKDPTEEEKSAPGIFTTPDEITDGLRNGANKTYNKARDISRQQQSDWQTRYDAALEQHRAEVDAHNKQVSDWNSEPDNKDNRLDPMMIDARPESLGVEERPKTFDELRSAVEEARGKTNPRFNAPDVVTKAREVELPKAEKAVDDWFKNNEHLISHAEYSSAKSLWADSERFNDIANNLRGKLAKGTLTGNDIRGLEPLIDGKARRWNQAKGTGTFKRLVGDETYANLQDIAKLFDPLDKSDPRSAALNSWGSFTAKHVIRLMIGGAAGAAHGIAGGAIGAVGGEVVGSLSEKFFNHVMFDPEFGSTFRDLADATKDFFEKGTAVPQAILARMSRLVQSLKEKGAGSETGAIGNVRQRNAGDFQATGKGLASPKFPKPGTPEVSKDDENITRGVIGTHDDMVSGLRGALGNDVFNPAKPTALPTERPASVNPNGDPRTAPNLDADLQSQRMAREEVTAGKLPEKDFLRRAQELKDQILAQHSMAPEGPVQVHHWSNQADLVETDPEFMGTGKAGEERARMDEPDFQKTTAFGTGDYREPRIQGQRYHYVADVNPLEYYNIETDPQGIWKKAFEKGGATAAEKAVRKAGYAGFRTSNQYRSFGKVPVRLHNDVHAIADEYNQSEGRPALDTTKVEVDPKRADIADQFDAMKHDPKNPVVARSYAALLRELIAQKKALEAKGYTFEVSDTDPYGISEGGKSAFEQLRDDVLKNKRIKVWSGGNPLEEGHPLAEPIPGMKGWTGNTLLRAVHDVMGHVAGGNDFSEKGEENAYNLHKQTFSKDALPALTTETKGQTSWFFNNKNVREGGALGNFAQQKAGLLPEFLSKPVLDHIKANKPFAVLTAENPQNSRVSDSANAAANQKMLAELRKEGFHPVEVEGHNRDVEGQKEHSFFVPDMDSKTAARYGRKYGQTAVLTQEGLHDLNRDVVNPSDNAKVMTGAEAANQPYYSSIGGTPFSVPLDFDRETHVPQDRTASEINTSQPRAVKSDRSIKASENRSNLATVDRATAAKPSGKTALGGETLGFEEKMARTVSKYDFMGDTEGMSHRAIIEKFVKHLSDNLEALWNMIPEELRNRTKDWYVGANKIAADLGKKHGYTTEQSAGVIAALSPQNEWDNNLGLAERTMDIYRNQQNHPYTEEMDDAARNLSRADTVSKTFKKMLRDIKGKKLKDVVVKAGDRVEGKKVDAETAKDVQDARRAVWIRLYDEAYGGSTVKSWSPEGEVVGDSDRDRSWIGADHGQKAVSIMDDGSVEHINEVMGKGHKIRNFYNNIVNPNSLNGHVTVDTHAVGAALMLPLAGDHVEVKHNFGATVEGTPGAPQHAATGLSGTYPLYSEAYERAAKKLGIRPRELQSSTWDAIRTLFEPKAKAGLLPQARDIWRQVGEGKITADDARKQIVELAGGLKQPKWMSDENWEKLGPEGDDTSFGAAAGAQPQMTSLSGEHTITADVPSHATDPKLAKWVGQPQPKVNFGPRGNADLAELQDAADWWNANDTPQNRLISALHEVAHFFQSHEFGISTKDAKISLGHRPVVAGQPVGEGLGTSPITGVSGGFVHPGAGWRDAFNNAQTHEETTHVLKGYLTQLMSGRAAEEMVGIKPSTVLAHASGDIGTAQDRMVLHGIPDRLHKQFLDMATASAKRMLTENWDTIQHIAQQMVQHPNGELIDSATFHKYRNGGVYGQP